MKRYFEVDEAASFLSEKCGQNIRALDVLEAASRGEIRLCIFYAGDLAPFKEAAPFTERALNGYPFFFRGFVKIPTNVISIYGGDMAFSVTEFVESMVLAHMETPPKLELFESFCPYICSPETGEAKPVYFNVNLSSAFIPASDLNALLLKREGKGKPIADSAPTHVSNDLTTLKQAAFQFWGCNVDRDDRDTYPKNNDVFAWLIEHKFSEVTAVNGAKIIRPEWARLQRKEK